MMTAFSRFELPCSLQPALAKLVEVVEEENATLRSCHFVFHATYTDRKNQALRELMAAQRQEDISVAAVRVRPLLQKLSRLLEENARLLKLHITAAGEISDIIVASLRDADSDGTYTRHPMTGSR